MRKPREEMIAETRAKLIAAGDWSAIRENAAKATAIAKAARALAQKTS